MWILKLFNFWFVPDIHSTIPDPNHKPTPIRTVFLPNGRAPGCFIKSSVIYRNSCRGMDQISGTNLLLCWCLKNVKQFNPIKNQFRGIINHSTQILRFRNYLDMSQDLLSRIVRHESYYGFNSDLIELFVINFILDLITD